MIELISRQAALYEIDKNRNALLQSGMTGAEHILVHYGRRVIEELSTIDVTGDLISRQAVEDLIMETDLFWCEGMTRAIFEGIKRLPTTEPKCARWIPCKKQMPKPNEVFGDVVKYYLVQNEFRDMMVASYNALGDSRWWEQMYHFKPIEDEIVAWMELPEEYKEGGEE